MNAPLVWSRGVPDEPGDYHFRCGPSQPREFVTVTRNRGLSLRVMTMKGEFVPVQRIPECEFAGPIPEPVDAKEPTA